MWQVETKLQGFLRATHRLVVDMLNWAWKHKDENGDHEQLRLLAQAAPGRLGRVAKGTDLDDRMATLATSPYIAAIRRDYFCIARDYRAFLEQGARLELTGKAQEVADGVFRYLYQSLLNSKTFWQEYDRDRKNGFSKQGYRKAFKEVRVVCPICDYNKVSVVATSEHFLTQSTFPVLTVFWLNIIVACSDCNSGARGNKRIASERGKRSPYVPIFHPFFDQVADHIRIPFGNEYKPLAPIPISLRASDRIRARNFCRVYELETRYAYDQPEAVGTAEDYWDVVKERFEQLTQTQPRTRDLLRRVAREYADAKRQRLMEKRGQHARVKFGLDLLTHLEGQVETLGNQLNLP